MIQTCLPTPLRTIVCLSALIALTCRIETATAQDATSTDAAGSAAQPAAGATAGPLTAVVAGENGSAATSIVKVQFGTGPDEWVWGAVVPDPGGRHEGGFLVVVPETYGVSEDLALDADLVDTRILKRAKERWNAATIVDSFTPEQVQFADCLPMLGAALLHVKSGSSDRPTFELSAEPLDPAQTIIVNHGPERHAGRLRQRQPADVFPWQVLLDDQSQPQPGAPVTNARGELLGIVKPLSNVESKATGHDPAETKSERHVLVPAAHLMALLVLPPPGIKENDALRALTAGMLLGAEQGRAQQLLLAAGPLADRPGTAALLAELNTPPELIVDRTRFGAVPSPIPGDAPLKFFPLQRLSPDAALKFLPYLFGDWVSFTAGPSQRGIVVRTTAEIQPVVEALLKVLDGDPKDAAQLSFTVPPPANLPNGKPFEIRLFPLEHLTVDQAGETVSKLYPWGSGVVLTKVPSHRALMARGTAELVERIAALIKELDVPGATATAEDLDGANTAAPAVVGPTAAGTAGRAMDGDEAMPLFGGGLVAGDEDDSPMLPGRAGRSRLGAIGFGPATAPPEPQVWKAIGLEHLPADEALDALKRLFGSQATFSASPNNRAVLAVGSADALKQIEDLLKVLDIEAVAAAPPRGDEDADMGALGPMAGAMGMGFVGGAGTPLTTSPQSEIRVFPLQHVDPRAAAIAMVPLFQTVQGGGGGRAGYIAASFVPVSTRRILIARAEPDVLEKIEALLKVLDAPDAEPAAAVEAAAEGTASAPRLRLYAATEEYQLKGARYEDVARKLFELQKSDGTEWFEVGVNTVKNTVRITGKRKSLDAASALIRELDPQAELVVLRAASADAVAVETLEGDLDALRREYASRTDQARVAAWLLHKAGNSDAAEARRKELTTAVSEAFDARQKLQAAEIAALEQRLSSMRRTLAAREKIKDEIIQRRFEELLNPALDWDTSSNKKPASGTEATTNPTIGAAAEQAAPASNTKSNASF